MGKNDFLVSMKFVGVDQVSPEMKKIGGGLDNLGDEAKQAAAEAKTLTKQLGDVGKVDKDLKRAADEAKRLKQSIDGLNGRGPRFEWINTMVTGIQRGISKIDELAQKAEGLRMDGLADIATGASVIMGGKHAVDEAAEISVLEMQVAGVYGMPRTGDEFQKITKQAQQISNDTLFNYGDILQIDRQLAQAQISKENLPKIVPHAANLAQAEIMINKSSSADRTAYNFARMAEDARITDDEKRMKEFADALYRTIFVTHASTESLGETFKMGMPVVKNLGWNEKDMLLASGMAAINGMEGTMAGVHIKDFAQRINPYKYLGAASGQKQLHAMHEAGFITDVETVVSKAGKEKIVGFGDAALLKDKDSIKGYADMMDVLVQKHDEFIAKGKKTQYALEMTEEDLKKLQDRSKELGGKELSGGELEWAAMMHHIFGEQGQDFAIISSHTDQYKKLKKSLDQQLSLEQMSQELKKEYKLLYDTLTNQAQNLVIEVGQALLPTAQELVKKATPYLENAGAWVDKNPETIVEIGKAAAIVGAFGIAVGGAKLALGTLGAFIKPITGLGKNFSDTFMTQVFNPIKSRLGGDALGGFKKDLPTRAINASVVNVYGGTVNGVGGTAAGGKGGAGAAGAGVGAGVAGASGAAGAAGAAARGKFGTFMSAAGSSLKGVVERGGKLVLPIAIGMGVWDVATAPEGEKIEAGMRTSGTLMGGWAGAEAGAAIGAGIGSIVPGAGTAIGGALGATLGGVAGAIAASKILEQLGWVKKQVANEIGGLNTQAASLVYQSGYGKDRNTYYQKNTPPPLWSGYNTSSSYQDNRTQNITVQTNKPEVVSQAVNSNPFGNSNVSKKSFWDSQLGNYR